MHPRDSLQRAFDACYEAFSVYPRPLAFHASPLRNSAEILTAVTSAPLRELSSKNLGTYAGYAVTTVGDAEDYKHFLPRIFELAIGWTGQPGLDAEMIALRLKHGNWREWPIPEQAAVEAVFAEAFAQARQEHVEEIDVQAWLCGMAILGMPLSKALDDWLVDSGINSGLQIAKFFLNATESLHAIDAKDRAFWGYVDEVTVQRLKTWIEDAPVIARMIATLDTVAPADRWIVEQAMKELAAVQSQTAH
ncbi:hypothetical protein [Rhizobium herbae]|uniref:3-methyladenine DNA glycosylase n=1 Tax=Rhizobium herbae TaxID=508661 RepID=A0ABS4ENI3_9HYPH|nr:hypothetical protein [Rhizobium herbae]MBP1859496.1 hypothetical protein [Rhizobium herbae]